jgi:excisionase family DNA binding protein
VNLPNSSEQTIDGASDRLLRKRELADRLGVSPRTLDEWQRRGRIAYLKIGKSCRYRWNDVIAKLQSYRVN